MPQDSILRQLNAVHTSSQKPVISLRQMLILSTHLRRLPTGLFRHAFRPEFCMHLPPPERALHIVLRLLDEIIQTASGEEYEFRRTSLCSFVQLKMKSICHLFYYTVI